jgi:hypothetical protein
MTISLHFAFASVLVTNSLFASESTVKAILGVTPGSVVSSDPGDTSLGTLVHPLNNETIDKRQTVDTTIIFLIHSSPSNNFYNNPIFKNVSFKKRVFIIDSPVIIVLTITIIFITTFR